ncbi:MAG TPA: glycoside hydrolase family 27 protein [Asticcacaulis sp.]|nr:glycoside hydrolase family 27 protein [Asticcacaulis sp.]
MHTALRFVVTIGCLALGLCNALPAAAHGNVEIKEPKPLLAMTPPMGWNSWNKLGCNINEAAIRRQADAMVSSGMKDAGYRYIIIDDCWQGSRDADGNIQPDPTRFPSGIKALADYIHDRGLKFGLYSDAGIRTCGGRPGSRGYEFQDARQYARWGVDYLKFDWCDTGTQDAQASYRIMAMALRQSGRDIVLSICEWGDNRPQDWAEPFGHLWRTTGDIRDNFSVSEGYSLSFLAILDKQAGLTAFSGPNHWNDPDMLEVGNGGMSHTEYVTHMSFWAMLAAPLIAGNDLSAMSKETAAILTNPDVIAIDQDTLGIQARPIRRSPETEVWARPLAGGQRAVILFNRSDKPQSINVSWEDLQYPATLRPDIKDLWTKAVYRKQRNGFAATVEPHGVVMLRVGDLH